MSGVPDVFCLPIKEKKKDKWTLIPHPEFGKGQYGTVYGACRRSRCGYVMKVIIFGKRTTEAAFNKEVSMQTLLAEHHITIPVQDSWKCRKSTKLGVIIMESLDITVKDFLVEDITAEDADAVIAGVRALMDALHALGYYHGDNHFGNIMMRRVHSESSFTVSTSLGIYRLYLIDFGKSGSLADPGTYPGGRPSTSAKRIKEDDVILTSEIKQVMARFHPEDLESVIM